MNRRTLLTGALALLARPAAFAATEEPLNARLAGDIAPVHDPCIIKDGATYHVFCTGQEHDPTGLLPWRTSTDLVTWALRGRVFEAMPAWARERIPGTRGLWAPDISQWNDRFHLYYSVSTFGSNRSAIGLATATSLDSATPGAWQDQGPVIESNPGDDFNAIDPNHIRDADGRHWLALGSFWSGIKLFALDERTGKPVSGTPRRYSLASRPAPEGAPGAIEAPFIIERDSYYYLFASYDYCCRGASSSYYIVVGRARKITGPYVGRDRKPMSDGYGTVVLQGNRRFRGPGHQAVLRDGAIDYLVYHAYDAEHDGRSTLRIAAIAWSPDGWPAVMA